MTNLTKKPITKKQASADILALADQLQKDSSCAPNRHTQLFYERMARDIKIAHNVHFNTTR